ncbi:MAG: phosphoribosylamine--glycine ligase [Candidatus Cloacimonas sp. SDB]|nr:MAG: phosphoribosylamine--glycine ligase [Candidatus Cloacimonas sp. SDB]
MKIAVLGSGGREHALTWKLEQSNLVTKVYTIPGNGGTRNNVNIDLRDFEKIKQFCLKEKIDLIFVGPEDPLVNGIVDFFSDTGIKVFGPDKTGALLEGSKIFAKRFMRQYGVATADFWEFGNISFDEGLLNYKSEDLSKFANTPKKYQKVIDKLQGNCVIKYNGLAAGKGVYVCNCREEAQKAIIDIQYKYGTEASYLIEEKLLGDELSILAFTDGIDYQLLQPSQDHKQLLENDKGPNTGGMGAFCPVPFFTPKLKSAIVQDIIKPTLQGIQQERMNYRGVLYFGLMITESGPKLLEYNVRLGDPETEVVLPALKNDFAQLVLSCFDGSLPELKMQFHQETYIDVVLVSGGYPYEYKKGYQIFGLDNIADDVILFHAGTKKENQKIFTAGGRVLNVVAQAESLNEAIQKAYERVNKFHFKKMFYRKDIGKRRK